MKHAKGIAALCSFLVAAGGAYAATGVCAKAPRSGVTVNVRDKGARGDGTGNDGVAIQSAVNQVVGRGGTVFIPDGIYMVDAVTGIKVGNNVTLRLSSGAVIKAIPNSSGSYSILEIRNASNVSIIGGTVLGERADHLGAAGEWGMGITLRAASNVVIEGVTVKNAWGDGFYVTELSRNIKLCSVVADNNRRQGMSIISADEVTVVDSTFKNTRGTNPQAGIDIEPNESDTVRNVHIFNSRILNNKGPGVAIYVANHNLKASVKNVTIKGNLVVGNISGGVAIYNSSGHQVVNNTLRDNAGFGIFLDKNTRAIVVVGNQIVGENGIRDDGGNAAAGNTEERCALGGKSGVRCR